MRSTSTFVEEFRVLRRVQNAFWESEHDFIKEGGLERSPFHVLYELERVLFDTDEISLADTLAQRPDPDWHIPDTGYVFTGSLDKVYRAAGRGGGDLWDAIHDETGIDLENALEEYIAGRERGRFRGLADLDTGLNTDAFGCYLPWHAYARSRSTPWGIYIHLEPLVAWTADVFLSGRLPDPRPEPLTVFNLLFNATFRHELFHYHVERFATRQEILQLRPLYRPYVSGVRAQVADSEKWLEEALAQAVVLESRFVANRVGLALDTARVILESEFRSFGPGYKDFECAAFGGVARAHRYLGTQVAQTILAPCSDALVTSFATPQKEYSSQVSEVPGYFVWHPHFVSQFQFATPPRKKFERFLNKHPRIEFVGPGPGDHLKYKCDGGTFQVNYVGKHVDLASLKDLANLLQMNLHQLKRAVAEV